MNPFRTPGLVVASVIVPLACLAADPCRSGLNPGQRPGPYAFIVSTGPNRGKAHCFICEAENRPMVIVFARSLNDPTGKLLRQLDQALVEHRQAELRAWATFLSDDEPKLRPQVTEWVRKLGLTNLSVGIFEDADGPPTYRLNREADVTVLLAVRQKVVANYAYRPGELTEDHIREILLAVPKLLEPATP
ncbi:MAG: hypothetical protein NZM31_04085 [Gemmatales bacterium]|nr:hypothetical protein [Gemmatales bacterium]MDW8386179.1 hypothetical protein [Gemmatales bacterium]